MNDVLRKIVDATLEELRVAPIAPSVSDVARSRRGSHRFRDAIAREGVNVIAEIKAASPSAGTIAENPEVETIAREYRDGGAAAISIVTEPRFFKGSRDWIARAKNTAGLPVIMKDFIVDPLQIYRGVAAGADAVLLLASLLEAAKLREFLAIVDGLGCDALVEAHDEDELQRAIDAGAPMIGVNNRNLRDFSVDLATSERLAAMIPSGVIKVTESGIKTRDDVTRLQRAGFTAFLVGESLLRQTDRGAAIHALVSRENNEVPAREGARHNIAPGDSRGLTGRESIEPAKAGDTASDGSCDGRLRRLESAKPPEPPAPPGAMLSRPPSRPEKRVRPLVKICGITRLEDGLLAARLGADFIGFVFARDSKRYVDPGFADEIAQSVRQDFPSTKIVGVFLNQKLDEVRRIAAHVALDLVQLHGDEDNEFIRALGRPVIKAFRIGDTAPRAETHPDAAWVMFDTASERVGGGSGEAFDWSLLVDRPRKPFFLAGGLREDNVAGAIEQVSPDAVDVSSGVEDAPGIKSEKKMRALFERIRG